MQIINIAIEGIGLIGAILSIFIYFKTRRIKQILIARDLEKEVKRFGSEFSSAISLQLDLITKDNVFDEKMMIKVMRLCNSMLSYELVLTAKQRKVIKRLLKNCKNHKNKRAEIVYDLSIISGLFITLKQIKKDEEKT